MKYHTSSNSVSEKVKHETWIVIAAYNEESRVAAVIKKLRRVGFKNIVVVDDGSRDRTSEVASSAGAVVARHKINRGQGAALQTGMEFALSRGAKFIVHFDADGQHDERELPVLLGPLVRDEVDVTLGSRFLESKSEIPQHRLIMLKVAILVNWILYGTRLSDAHNGYRAFSRYAAERVKITMDGPEHASEIVGLVKSAHLRFIEVPVTIKYSEETLRKGKTSLRESIKVAMRLLMRRLVG